MEPSSVNESVDGKNLALFAANRPRAAVQQVFLDAKEVPGLAQSAGLGAGHRPGVGPQEARGVAFYVHPRVVGECGGDAGALVGVGRGQRVSAEAAHPGLPPPFCPRSISAARRPAGPLFVVRRSPVSLHFTLYYYAKNEY